MTGTRFHPWRRMRQLGPAWKLAWSPTLPNDAFGRTSWRTRTITLRTGMSFEERRSTITHEVEHVLRGPFSACNELREEGAVNERCGRLLIPSMQELADALVWHHGDYEATAEELWVDPWTLEVRLGTLYRLERDYLHKRLAEVELLRAGA